MIMLVGLGLACFLSAHPLMAAGMRWASMAWLVWLAWKIASAPVGSPDAPPALRRQRGQAARWPTQAWATASAVYRALSGP